MLKDGYRADPKRTDDGASESPETRVYAASQEVDWIVSERSYPGQPRFTNIKTLVKVYSRAEHADRCTFVNRFREPCHNHPHRGLRQSHTARGCHLPARRIVPFLA
jgi:hypothetical protein